MISIEDSIPKKSENYLRGQDIIWSQFNDINFYVEDIDQENFYLQILKKLFPLIKIRRIFPLGGKSAVLNEAEKSLGKKNKIFILDLDFDEILGKKKFQKNVFYLKRYSIENYLLERAAIFELVREEKPKITDQEIISKFNFDEFQKDCSKIFKELACNFLLIKKYELGLKYLKIEPVRDCDFGKSPPTIRSSITDAFFKQIENELKFKNPRLKYLTQISKLKKYFRTQIQNVSNIPGKYLLSFLKIKLKKLFSFTQTSFDTFVYRLAKNCELNELKYLKLAILKYKLT